MNPDAGHPKIHAFRFPPLTKVLSPAIKVMGACDSACRKVRLVAEGIEENLDSVTDDFRHCAFVSEYHLRHPANVFVKQRTEHFGGRGFHQ